MGKRILIVEDDVDLRMGVTELLESEGYEIIAARDGREGWEILQRDGEQIQLILLDFTLPYLDAKDFRQLQRSSERVAQVPVVLFSAAVINDTTMAALSPNAILKKPVDIDDLISTVQRFVA